MAVAPKAFGEKCVRRGEREGIQLTFFARTHGPSAAVALGEFFDTSGRIDEFLFAGEKRMTSGADTDSNVAASRAGMINRAARATHVGFVIFWMDAFFHSSKMSAECNRPGYLRKR
jgi:hypothetical protein